MPLFKVGSFGQIGVTTSQIARVIKVEHKDEVKFPRVLSIDAMREASFNIEPPKIDLAKSEKKWGLFLKNLSLYERFKGFIANLFNPTNEIFFTSMAWDFSGSPPFFYPPKGANASDFLIPMKAKTTRTFIGDGVNLWPSQYVTGALNLVFLVYDNHQNVRDVGDLLVNVHDTVQG